MGYSRYWTPERDKLLADLWGVMPSRMIGEKLKKEFGGEVTGNMVIGRANRRQLAKIPDLQRGRWISQLYWQQRGEERKRS